MKLNGTTKKPKKINNKTSLKTNITKNNRNKFNKKKTIKSNLTTKTIKINNTPIKLNLTRTQ